MRFRYGVLVSSFAALALVGGSAFLPPRGVRPTAALSVGASSTQSLQLAKQRVRLNPQDASAHAKLGLAFLQKVKADADPTFYGKAEAALTRSLALDENNFEGLFGMATLSLGRHDFKGGLRWGMRAHEANPYSSDALGALGDGYLEQGRYRDATRTFQSMVDLRPGLPAFARISYLRELTRDTDGAIRAMRLAQKSAGSSADAAWCLSLVGDLYLNSGRPNRARVAYKRASRLDPGAPSSLHGLAKIAVSKGRLGRAARAMERVVDVNQEPGYAIFLGDLYTRLARPGDAQRAYRLARELESIEEANGVDVNLESSLFAADHGYVTEALRRAREEYAKRRSVQVSDAYAWALYSNGNFTMAKRLSDEAFRLRTRSPLFYFHAGMIDMALGRTKEARSELRMALDLNPTFSVLHASTAKKALVRLGEKR